MPLQSRTLSRLNQRFAAILQNLPQMVWLKDTECRYVGCNPPYEALMGVAQAQLLGKTDEDFFPPEQAQLFRSQDLTCLKASQAMVREQWVDAAPGSPRVLLEITKLALLDAEGQPSGILSIGNDITAGWNFSAFDKLRTRILELLAEDAELSYLLQVLTRGFCDWRPQQSCLVALVTSSGASLEQTLRVAASAGLPSGLPEAINGVALAQSPCACAVAARTGQRVVIPNLAEHRLGADTPYIGTADLAVYPAHGACWAQPFFEANGAVLGVLLVHTATPSAPTAADIDFLEQLARLAALAVQRRQVTERLHASEAGFRALVEHTPEAVLVHRAHTILYVNPAALKLFGASANTELLGTSVRDRIAPGYLLQHVSRLQAIEAGEDVQPLVESRFVRLDGSEIDVEAQGTAMLYGGQPAIQVSIRDISERKRAQKQLLVAASVFSHALEGIMITGPDGRIMDINASFSRITGYNREEVLGQTPSILNSGHNSPAFYQQLWQSLLKQGSWSGDLWNRRKDGSVYAQMLHISAVHDQRGEVMQYVALFSDITERKSHEQRLNHLAHFDALTGLPNRTLHADRLQHAMIQAKRRGVKLGLAFVDLDGFKAINDSYGHEAGDHLLITLARRMRMALRESDTLSRLGGDEFAAVIVDLQEEHDCNPLLERLLAAANQPVLFGSALLQVTASVGVTFFPQAKEMSPEQLLSQADRAMYRAKQAGKNQFQHSGFADSLS